MSDQAMDGDGVSYRCHCGWASGYHPERADAASEYTMHQNEKHGTKTAMDIFKALVMEGRDAEAWHLAESAGWNRAIEECKQVPCARCGQRPRGN